MGGNGETRTMTGHGDDNFHESYYSCKLMVECPYDIDCSQGKPKRTKYKGGE